MHRIKHVPIEKPCQSGRIKNSGLPNDGASAICFHLQLQPCAAGISFQRPAEFVIRHKGFHSPEIQNVAGGKCMRIATAPGKSHAPYNEIQEAPKPPENIGKVPAIHTFDALNRSKSCRWRNRYLHCPKVDEPSTKLRATPRPRLSRRGKSVAPTSQGEFLVFMVKSSLHRFSQTFGLMSKAVKAEVSCTRVGLRILSMSFRPMRA